MRFIYGLIMGVLVTVVSAILYLAFSSGDYLLQLSPHYHEMTSEIASLKDAKQQRDQLATRLETLASGFEQLTRRFNELQETTRESACRGSAPQGESPPSMEPAHPRPGAGSAGSAPPGP
jgi:uncharacterized phage infection (PIP) family protein YhgE